MSNEQKQTIKKCELCGKTSKEASIIETMGEIKCTDCMRKEIIKDGYDVQKEFHRAAKNLKKWSK